MSEMQDATPVPSISFYDKDGKVSVGEVPLSEFLYLPRVGEILSLPKIQGAHDGGYYKVTHIIHSFIERGIDTGETVFFQLLVVVRKAEGDDMPRRAIDEEVERGNKR